MFNLVKMKKISGISKDIPDLLFVCAIKPQRGEEVLIQPLRRGPVRT